MKVAAGVSFFKAKAGHALTILKCSNSYEKMHHNGEKLASQQTRSLASLEVRQGAL